MLRTFVLALVVLCAARPAQCDVRISQIYGGGGQVGSPYASDFVELYNSGAAQDLSGWSIQYASAAGSTWSLTQLPPVVLGPGEYLLIKQLDGTALPVGQSAALPNVDASGNIGLSTTDGKVALCSTLAQLSGPQPSSPAIVDFVGYGPLASWREPFLGGSAADNAPSGAPALALFRGICGDLDQNRNSVDFVRGYPMPRGRTQLPTSGWSLRAAVVPHFAKVGQSIRLIVSAADCSGVSAPSSSLVVVDASSIGGPTQALATDDGQAPDELADDGLFTASFVVAQGTSNGSKTLHVELDDGVAFGGALAAVLVKGSSTPDNDDCARAENLSGAFPLSASAVLSNASSEWSPVLHESSFIETMGARRGLWYRVLGTGNTMSADTCASPLIGGTQIPDTVLMVLGGTCEGLTRIGFDDDVGVPCGTGSGVERRSRVSWCSQLGAPYFVWVAPFNSGPAGFTVTLRIDDGGVACATAPSVDVCTPWASGGTVAELEPSFGPERNDGCDALTARFRDVSVGFPAIIARGHARSAGSSRDVDWYRFQAGVSDVLELEWSAAFLAAVELHALSPLGGCTGAPPLASHAPDQRCSLTTLSHPVTAGSWYAVRVEALTAEASDVLGGVFIGASSSAYRLSMRLGDVTPNDDCANAFTLACGASVNGATVGASVELGSVPNNCGGPGAGTSGSYALTGPGVWYRVALPGLPGIDDRTVYVETLNVDFDTRLSVFAGPCGGLSCVTSNDDIDASGRSMVAWKATASQPYFVLVHGAGTTSGSFEIRANCETSPANDECSAAELLPPSSSLVGTTRGATGAPANFPLGGPTGLATCVGLGATNSSYFDVWYAFDAPCSTNVTIDTCGAEDTVLSVHSACPTSSSSLALAGACSDDGSGVCAPGSRVSFAAVGGAQYLIRVARKLAADDGGAFTIRATLPDSDGDGVDDCADGCAADPLKSAPGQCGCGVSDVDSDGDGVADCLDGCPADPNKLTPGICGCGVSDVDSDGDGVADCLDGCPADPNKLTPGVCGCGVSDVDSDGDGVADCLDGCPADPNKLAPGVCGCGVSDVDSDGDGVADCLDGCPADPNKLAPGVCGCGVSDLDSDADTVPDCVDNCPTMANTTQDDCDVDGMGDVCELAAGLATDLDLDGTPDNCEWGLSVPYCTGSTSAQGCVAVVSSVGVPSASAASSFVIETAQIDGARNGLQFYGRTGPASLPFGPGVLCLHPPRQRTHVQNTGGTVGSCGGRLVLDWNAFAASSPGALGLPASAGDVFWIQPWWRDPSSPGATALGHGLQFTFAP